MHLVQWVLGWSLTVCASNKLPDAAPWTTLSGQALQTDVHFVQRSENLRKRAWREEVLRPCNPTSTPKPHVKTIATHLVAIGFPSLTGYQLDT